MGSAAIPAPAGDPIIRAALIRLGLLAETEVLQLEPLAGGVSSDIWKVETASRTFCVKRALAKLKVAQDWQAPVERSRYEYAWLEEAARHARDAVPRLYGYDDAANLFALEWLDPARYVWWKGALRDGDVDPQTAEEVGRRLAAIHAGTAERLDVAQRFGTDAIFHAIRLEPYLLATARAHPDLAPRLEGLAADTAAQRLCLVHGDVSPKNILIGPRGPVLLDAECAWYGDPAFDVAFCLNHLLLKGLWNRGAGGRLILSFAALWSAYASGVTWEPGADVEARVAALLPGLLLARIDGKSPVEYLTEETDRALVRGIARDWLGRPHQEPRLAALLEDWRIALRIPV